MAFAVRTQRTGFSYGLQSQGSTKPFPPRQKEASNASHDATLPLFGIVGIICGEYETILKAASVWLD